MRFLEWECGGGGFVWKYSKRGVLQGLGVRGAWALRCSDGNGMVMAEPPFVIFFDWNDHLTSYELSIEICAFRAKNWPISRSKRTIPWPIERGTGDHFEPAVSAVRKSGGAA